MAQVTDEVVGDMKCFVDTSLKRSEFFMYIKLGYKIFSKMKCFTDTSLE
ncbi:hypothetical protein [Romboutsia ilealis]|nr:hypothetical protein [Romboutsia ilealis]